MIPQTASAPLLVDEQIGPVHFLELEVDGLDESGRHVLGRLLR